jgi:hypothetical protein
MAKLLKTISLIYLLFILVSLSFFYYQLSKNLISKEIFFKVFGFSIGFIILLMLSYKFSKNSFDSAIENMNIDERMAVPPIMLIFLGGFSIALAIIFIAFLGAVGVLFIVKTVESLILNVLALVCFFWMSFILFMGWDFIKIIGTVSQYSMVKDIEKGKKPTFISNMKFFFGKLSSVRDAFLAFIAVDLSCRSMPKMYRGYYRSLLLPVKIWCACTTLYENKNVADSLKEAFEYFRTKAFKSFYTENIASLFLILILIPVGFSLSIVLSNFNYFSNFQCFLSSCFFIIIFFLIFISLGFFFSYSISMSLESAYYVKILSDIKNGTIIDTFSQYRKIKYIEEESYKRMSELSGSIFDILRIYF